MADYRIAAIPGDGVGTEVTAEVLKVLGATQDAVGDLRLYCTHLDWGSEYYLRNGVMMPGDALDRLEGYDAIFLGAIGDPRVPDHVTLHGLLLTIRKGFNQYVCLRPVRLYEGVPCPIVGKTPADIDMLVVRENVEGEYAHVGGIIDHGRDNDVAIQTAVFTRKGTERVIRYAFDLARKSPRRKVTSITKSNAQAYGMVFWDRVFEQVAHDYPGVETDKNLIDAAAMNFIRRPEAFDVVVASNLFGDILTDIGAMISGGMGLAASANLNPERDYPSMFETVHGSAPDIAGKGIVNPMAAILAAKMMVAFLGEQEAAGLIEAAVSANLKEGKVKTPDLGGKAGTADVGDDIARRVRSAG